MHRTRAVALLLCVLTLYLPLRVGADSEDEENPGWYQSPPPDLTFETESAATGPEGEPETTLTPAGPEGASLSAFTLAAGESASASSGSVVDAITPEIQALAAGLHDDPVQIYAYVHNHITYEHYYGTKKGAALTLFEGSGNDFDHCALLVALLRAAGLSPQYRFGSQWIAYDHATAPNLVQWLGLDPIAYPGLPWSEVLAQYNNNKPDPWPGVADEQRKKNHLLANAFLRRRGTPAVTHEPGLARLRFQRVWVQVDVGGLTYQLDPVVKPHAWVAGLDLQALQAAAGYDRTALLQAVGGTSTPESIAGLDEATLHTTLTAATSHMQATLRSMAPQATPLEVVGGLQPLQETITSLPQTLPLPTSGVIQTWDTIPEAYIAKLVLTLKTSATTIATTMLLPALQGQKLALTFAGNTALVWLEDTVVLQHDQVSGATVKLTVRVDHPGGSGRDQAETKTYTKRDDFAYALIYGFTPSERLLRHRQWRLDALRREATAAYGSLAPQQIPEATLRRRLLTEILNVLGLQWLYQTALSEHLLAAQRAVLPLAHHRFGRMAQEEGYYVDVGLQMFGGLSRTGTRADEQLVFSLSGFFASAMEHGVLEQIPGTTSPAVSTMKLLQLATRSTDTTRDELFLANASTFSTVRPRLQGYTTTFLNDVATKATAGTTFLLPEHAQYTLGDWTGTGYVSSSPTQVGMIITVGYQPTSGGTNADKGPVSLNACPVGYNPAGDSPAAPPPPATPFRENPHSRDPVEMASGAFVVQHADLTLGAAAPRGIQVVRSYHSGRRQQDDAQFGYGWRHTYANALLEQSAFAAALGATTPAEMAPFLVATVAALDVYSSATTAKTWATAALIAVWGVEQLRQNAVAITLGTDTLQFLRLPDGTYQAPANTPMTLTRQADGSYVLQERLGNSYHFPSALGHRLSTITDPEGLTLTCTYDGSGRLDTVRDAYGRTVTFTYTNGRLTSVGDSTGRTVTYAYDSQGNLQTVRDPLQYPTTFEYDAEHRLTVVRDALGRVMARNTYDAEGRVTEQRSADDPQKTWRFAYSGVRNTETDPLGGTTAYLYDARGRAVGTEDALGHRRTLGYDGQDHVVTRTTPKGETTQWTYDADHRLVQVVDPLNASTTYTYDGQHRPLQISQSDPASGSPPRVTTLTYEVGNATTRPNTITDPRGLRTRYVYNTDGTVRERWEERTSGTWITTFTYSYAPNNGPLQTLRMTAPDGASTETTYDQRGGVVAERDANGLVTTHTSNARRQRTSTTAPDGGITTYIYNAVGDLVEVRNPRGMVTRSTYSPTGKLLTVTTAADTAEAQTVAQTYDARDWRVATRNAANDTTQFVYDAAERLVAVSDPLGRVTQVTVDANGQRTALTRPSTRTTQWTYNARGQRVTQTEPDGALITWQSTAFEDLQRLTPPGQGPYLFTTDANGQLLTTRTPRTFTTTQTWNDRHLLATVQAPSGLTTTFTYDAQGRVATQSDSLGTRTLTYDAAGNVLRVQEGTAVSTRTYDNRHRVASYTDPRGRTLQYAYDLHGNLTQLTYPDGKTVTYTYDLHDRLVTVRDWANRLTRYTWDAAHRLRRLERPNGTTRILTYDQAGQLLQVEERDAEGVLLAAVRLAYDGDGQPRQRLVLPVPPVLVVPPATMTVDADNRVTTVNGAAVTHDADGQVTASYTFDARHRLQSVGGVSYSYDVEGYRTALTTSAGTLRYTVDPHGGDVPRVLVREELNGSPTLAVYGLDLLYEVEASGVVRYYHSDETGSTIALTDASGLVVTDRMGYGPFGTLVVRKGTTPTPYLYGGAFGVETDPNGLLYMRARYYHPLLRRFLSPDLIGFAGGFNWYAYAGNNPYQFVDPTGLGRQNLPEGSLFTRALDSLSPEVIPTITTAAGAVLGGLIGGGGGGTLGLVATPAGAVVVGTVGAAKGAAIGGTIGYAVGLFLSKAIDASGGEASGQGPSAQENLNVADDIVLSGGRNGSNVKNLTGPPNSAVKGSNGRVFVTNDKGEVILDITKDRVKPVTPGRGFGRKRAPTQEEIDLINQVHGGGSR